MNKWVKAKREIARIVNQATDPLRGPYEHILTTLHDRRFSENVRCKSGDRGFGSKVAIYHAFQPDGILVSTLLTLKHLAAHQYSIVFVSNAEISQSDFERIREDISLYIARHNFGHDFGGYRDAIKVIGNMNLEPDRLLIMNDSIWYPLSCKNGLLEEMQESTDGLTGPVFERKEGRSHQGHFESYMLSLGPKAVQDASFSNFWSSYKLTSARRRVLLNGEKGFSRALLDSGVPSATFCSRALFVDRISKVDDSFLFDTLTYAEHADERREESRKEALLLANGRNFRSRALSHIGSTVEKGSIQESFPFAAMVLFNLPLMKKRNQPATLSMRRAYLRAIEAGKLPEPELEILSEMMSPRFLA